MKLFLAAGMVFLLVWTGYAQQGQLPKGSIYGKVMDSVTGKGIDAASIQVFQQKLDSATHKPQKVLVTGMLTKNNGEFELENIPVVGQLTVEVSGIGYKPSITRLVFIDPQQLKNGIKDPQSLLGSLNKDLGNIKLSLDNESLDNVTVVSSKPTVQLGIDRKVYNVEKNLMAAGGTATDLLKNIPSVNVDIDGNISIRNSSPQIFVDGRPTNLTLDQIPSDQIESVEVITNPSAKYDASGGTAGILNIVLKKNKRVGYSGNIRAGVDQRGKLNAGANINVRQGKFNFFANGNYGQRKSISDGTTERNTFLKDTTTRLLQTDRNIGDGTFMFGRVGFDYFLDNRNTITISGVGVKGDFDNSTNSTLYVDTLADAYTAHSKTIRTSQGGFNFNNLGASVGYVHNFPKTGHQLTADFNYNKSHNNNSTTVSNNIFDDVNGSQTRSFNQLQNGKGNNERLTAQIDYTNPLSANSKFEAGARINQRKVVSLNDLLYMQPDGQFELQPLLSSSFNYKDQVLAGYANFSSKIGESFGYQVGVRLESSNYSGTVATHEKDASGNLVPANNYYKINYPVNLFPSVFISQKLNDQQELQLNYSRRIDRPGFFQLFPFTDYSDSLNLNRGNPNLKPEFTNSFELSYSNNFNRNNNLLLSLYYKTTSGLITRYQSEDINPINNQTVLVNTYINANKGYVGGFEAVGKNKITPWWDLTSNLNVYTSKINVDDPSIPTTDQLYSWFAKINNDFKLMNNLTFQLSGDYNSKTVLGPGGSSGNSGGNRGFMGGSISGNAQGYNMPNYGVDAALKYEFLKNKAASITLSVNDVFKTRQNEVYTNSTFFNQHQIRTRDQQLFRINFAYNFGKFDASLFKRKNMKNERESMQGSMEGMGQ